MSIDYDKKVMVKNLCEWALSFPRINGVGDFWLNRKASQQMTAGEIISQVQSNNTMFTGIDGKGAHARIYIDDKETRVEVGFEEIDDKKATTKEQEIITDEKIKSMFALKSQTAFENAVRKATPTFAEKAYLAKAVKRLGFNDYNKIKFIETYSGISIED